MEEASRTPRSDGELTEDGVKRLLSLATEPSAQPEADRKESPQPNQSLFLQVGSCHRLFSFDVVAAPCCSLLDFCFLFVCVKVTRSCSNARFALPCKVVKLRRFLNDATLLDTPFQQPSGVPGNDLFELVLSDGENRTACILSPAHNRVVHCGLLRRLSVIAVSAARFWLDETRLGSEPVCVLSELRVVGPKIDRVILRTPGQEYLAWIGSTACVPYCYCYCCCCCCCCCCSCCSCYS